MSEHGSAASGLSFPVLPESDIAQVASVRNAEGGSQVDARYPDEASC